MNVRTTNHWIATLRSKVLLLLGGAACLTATTVPGALIPGLYGTGVNTNGELLAPEQVDPHYTLVVSPDPGAPGPNAYTLVDAWPLGTWANDGPNSKWIAPSPTQATGNAEGNYTFRTTFDLTGFDPSTARIQGAWAVDNTGVDVVLNGVSLGIVNNNGFATLSEFLIESGFIEGTNVLDIIVYNAPATPNPIGLRMDIYGTVEVPNERPELVIEPKGARAVEGDNVTFTSRAVGPDLFYEWYFNDGLLPGENSTNLVLTGVTTNDSGDYQVVVSNFDGAVTSRVARLEVFLAIPNIFSTGVDNAGVALTDNSVDPHYTLVLNPDSASADCVVQDSSVFPISDGTWLRKATNSAWIGPRFNTEQAAGGDYTYRLTIDLTGFLPTTAYLVGDWTSDNLGTGVSLNGIPTGISNGGNFNTLNPFIITNGFISGINVLEFHVNNATLGYTGLRVQNLRAGALPGLMADVPPIILVQPQDRDALTGESVTFTVLADGKPPLRYQWFWNDGQVTDATNASLTLTGVTAANSGEYYVTVSNDFGPTNSATVTLVVHPPIPGLFNTGVDDTGALLPNNTPDPHYFLIVNPDTNSTTPAATTMAGGWPVAPAGPYLAEGPASRWLFPPSVNEGTNSAHGVHVFATTFDLTGYDPNTALIRCSTAVDDNVLDIVLNGNSLGLQNLSGFANFTTLTITNGFVCGLNTLAFVVNNGGDGFFMNPCAFRAELKGTAEPTTCIWPDATLVRSAPGQNTQEVTVHLPPGLNQSAAVDVTVTSADPSVAEPLGATGGSLTLTFPAGGATALDFTVNAKQVGTTTFTLAGPAEVCIGTNVTVQVGETFLRNPSFEDNYNPTFPSYSAINNWTALPAGGTGVNEATGPFWDNGVNADRSRAGFVQGTGGIFQELSGLVPGKTYWLQFSYNVRNCCGGTMELTVRFNGKPLTVIPNILPVGAGVPFNFVNLPFTATAEFGILEFATLAVGDASFVIDAVSVVQRDNNDVVVVNPSFEVSGNPAWPGYLQPAPLGGWTWSGVGSYGVNRTGEGPFADNGVAQEQRGVLLLQNEGAGVSQVVSNLVSGTEYTLSYAYNARGGNTPSLRTTIDGNIVHDEAVAPVGVGVPYYSTNIPFTATSDAITLVFTQTAAGDNTILIDNVRITGAGGTGIPLNLRIEPGNLVRLAWPAAAAGWTLQSSAVVHTGYVDTGLPVSVEGDENVVYDTIETTGNKFYRLFHP